MSAPIDCAMARMPLERLRERAEEPCGLALPPSPEFDCMCLPCRARRELAARETRRP
jgi:hypothetical protein